MKKILLIGLIPVFFLSAFFVVRVNAVNDIDYEVALGNSLSGVEYDSNTYIETPNKTELNYNFIIPNTFDKMAEDDELELYLEPETLAIAIRVKANGYVYASYNFNDTFVGKSDAVINPMKSGVTLDLYKESTPVSTSYLDMNPIATGDLVAAAESTIQPITNGFKAKIDFNHPEIMIRFDLNVQLENGNLVVNIPADSIVEYNPNIWDSAEQFYILRNIVVFPYFGSTRSENDGYVFIPDGSGALISLESAPETKASFSLDVYGDDLGYMSPTFRVRALSIKPIERVTMPIFGMVHDVGNTGFYVIGEEGASYSELNFKSAGLINDYYSTYFKYRYRESYEQYQSRSNEDQYRIAFQDDINDYDVTLRYNFLSGNDADYVGMAKSYQSYLLDNDQLGPKNRTEYSETPTKIDFIGTEITQGILSTKTQEATTYNEIVDTLKTLEQDGYTEVLTSLKTFDMRNSGYRFDIFRQLGGKNDFKDMMEYFEASDIAFSYYIDYTRSYESYSRKHAQTLSKREIYHVELSRMFFAHLVNDTSYYLEFAQDDVDEMKEYNIESVTLSGLDRAIYTSYKDGIKYSTENINEVNDTLAYFNDNGITTGMYLPDAYMYQYVNEYYDAPLSSSDFSFIVASVPFVQLVLGGYVDMYSPYLNFASDEEITLLRLVEYGVFPSYILTGGSTYDIKKTNSSNVYISEYGILKNRMDLYYAKINEGLTSTIGKEMIDHIFLASGVVLVEYDDGTQLIINYNDEVVTVDTTLVPAKGYVVIS